MSAPALGPSRAAALFSGLLTRSGLSPADLARRLRAIDPEAPPIAPSTLSRYRTGKRRPAPGILLYLDHKARTRAAGFDPDAPPRPASDGHAASVAGRITRAAQEAARAGWSIRITAPGRAALVAADGTELAELAGPFTSTPTREDTT